MAMLEHVTTHVADGKALLLSQFKDKPKFTGLLAAYLTQVQQLEDAIYDVYALRMIANAGTAGAQLDVIGKIVGQKRGGATDAQYLVYLSARIRTNFSSGTMEDVLRVAALLIPTTLMVREGAKSVEIETTAVVTPANPYIVWRDFLEHAKSAGTRLSLIYNTATQASSFMFADVAGGTTTGLGYGDAVAGLVGGVMAGVAG